MDEIVSHPHDALVRLEQEHIDIITTKVSDIVAFSKEREDPEYAFRYGDMLCAVTHASWCALGHLTYELSKLWGKPPFESDYDLLDVAAARWNKSRQTMHRHLEIWKWVIVKPEHTDERLRMLYSKPFDALWQLVGMVKADEITEEIWQRIEKAVNKAELKQIREDVRGLQRGATRSLKIMLERDGTIKGRRGNEHYKVAGYLNVHSDDPTVQAVVERCERGAGMFRR